jgi:hypothetical protein
VTGLPVDAKRGVINYHLKTLTEDFRGQVKFVHGDFAVIEFRSESQARGYVHSINFCPRLFFPPHFSSSIAIHDVGYDEEKCRSVSCESFGFNEWILTSLLRMLAFLAIKNNA